MKKLQQRSKLNNGGFSLVELIIVVAIMAVLIGVLAPQYLKYVENTRVQKDETAAEEFRRSVEIAISDEDIFKGLGLSASSTTVTVTAPDNGSFSGGTSDLLTELGSVIDGSKIDYTSSAHNGQSYTATITYNSTTGTVSVAGAWSTPTP